MDSATLFEHGDLIRAQQEQVVVGINPADSGVGVGGGDSLPLADEVNSDARSMYMVSAVHSHELIKIHRLMADCSDIGVEQAVAREGLTLDVGPGSGIREGGHGGILDSRAQLIGKASLISLKATRDTKLAHRLLTTLSNTPATRLGSSTLASKSFLGERGHSIRIVKHSEGSGTGERTFRGMFFVSEWLRNLTLG